MTDDPKDEVPSEQPVVNTDALTEAQTVDDILAATNVPWNSTDNRGASDFHTKDR